MKRFAVAGSLMMFAFAGVILADDKALQELAGTYSVSAMEKAGKPAPKDITDTLKINIKGDEFTIVIGSDEKKAKIKVDATAKPATIDINPSDGPEKGKSFAGIYKLDKGELTIAFVEKGDRPKDFKSEGDAILVKLKKDEKK